MSYIPLCTLRRSDVLLDFQLTYARKEWYEEKASWQAVIFLNLVRNVNEIVAHLTSEMSDLPYNADDSQEDLSSPRPARALPRLKFTDFHRDLRQRLSPLQDIQLILENQLGSASLELHFTTVNRAAPFEATPSSPSTTTSRRVHEFSINSSNGWKSALDRFRTKHTPTRQETESIRSSGSSSRRPAAPERDIAGTIASCREDIKTLWEDDIVRELLIRRKVRPEDAPGL